MTLSLRTPSLPHSLSPPLSLSVPLYKINKCTSISRNVLPLSASTSVEAWPVGAASVKKVPSLRPVMMVLMAFSWWPLQITTLTPRSSAHVAAFTCRVHAQHKHSSRKHIGLYINASNKREYVPRNISSWEEDTKL